MTRLSLAGWLLVVVAQVTPVSQSDFKALERRVDALEKWQLATVTGTRDYETDSTIEAYVDLKRRVQRIEKKLGLLE